MLLSRPAVSVGAAIRQKRVSNADEEWFMVIKSYRKNLDATIYVHAAHGANSNLAASQRAAFDGSHQRDINTRWKY
jgi:hypothetical protein